jgi:flagellar motor switch protein FliG
MASCQARVTTAFTNVILGYYPLDATHQKIDGIGRALATLRSMPEAQRQNLLPLLASRAPILVQLSKKLGFIFCDLTALTDASWQHVLTSIAESRWLAAWKLSDKKIRECILGNLSEDRRREFLAKVRDQAPMPRSQVIRVQMKLASDVQRLLTEGKVQLLSRQ